MASDIQSDILKKLDSVIADTVSDIHLYTQKSSDFTRNRKLNATTTIKTVLNMQGNSLNAELLDAFPDVDERMTASAFEQAKGKLKPECFEHIFHEFNKTMDNPKLLNNTYRVFAVDGSDFNVPYEPKSAYVVPGSIGKPKKDGSDSKPFSIVHANMLYDILNRTYQDCILQPRSQMNERAACIDMLHRLDCGKSIVIMDRGYDGFNMIENCNRIDDLFYVIRTKTGVGGIREIAELPDKETDTEMTFRVTTSDHYYKTHKDTENIHRIRHHNKHYKDQRSKNTIDRRWDFEQFCNVKCRVVKFRINESDTGKEQWEVLVTNLNRFEFPVNRMKELYHMQWDIETSFRELKYSLGGIHFHSKKDSFIQMEIFAHLVMFNAVSRSISQINVPQTNHKYPYSVDFKMACQVVRKYYRLHNNEPPDRMLAEIVTYINPVREGRSDERNLKPKSAVGFLYRVA